MRPATRFLRRVLPTLWGVALAPILTPAPAAGQQAAPMSATLLRRLAEAVDAQRNNKDVWVVIQPQFPHAVKGVFYSPLQATDIASRLEGYVALGPFRTAPDAGTTTLMFAMDPCPGLHDQFSWCPDPDTGSFSSSAAVPQEDVDSVAVTIYSRRRAPMHRTLPKASVDALFFTLSAIDKFVIPYYTRLYGPDFAARMRADYLRRVGQSGIR